MTDASSVEEDLALADAVSRRTRHLEVVVNNVGGGGFAHRQETVDGFEATLAINFVALVALTQRLMPLVMRTGARSSWRSCGRSPSLAGWRAPPRWPMQ